MTKRVAVIGAGLAGLNAARTLRSRGLDVSVFEAHDSIGGRMRSENIDGFICDRGFQVVNAQYAEIIESGVAKRLDIRPIPKGAEMWQAGSLRTIGDPRTSVRHLLGDLSSKTGRLKEKIEFLRYLARSTEDISFGAALDSCGSFFHLTLKPFLDGVTLCDCAEVDNRMVRELIHWFIKGNPGIPRGGAQALPNLLAEGLSINLNSPVEKIGDRWIVVNGEKLSFDALIMATDPRHAASLLKGEAVEMNSSTTWFHAIPAGLVTTKYLRIPLGTPFVNSIFLSNIAPELAPVGYSLIASTTLRELGESEVSDLLRSIWKIPVPKLIYRATIEDSLPMIRPGHIRHSTSKASDGLYVAGDWRSIPAQQGALLSGRLCAQEVIADLAAL